MKKCNKCEIEKEFSDFHTRKDSKDGYRNSCKNCVKLGSNYKESMKKYYEKNKENRKEKNKEYFKEYYEKNRDKILENVKVYVSENKDKRNTYLFENKNKINITQKKYKIKNKDKINEYRRNRLNSNPLFKLIENIRSNITTSITKHGYIKSSKTQDILGITFEEFKNYIENQFLEGMTWENHGEWHLDHKTPISWAKTEEEIYELNYYTNFQPLWAFDNQSKGNKWSG